MVVVQYIASRLFDGILFDSAVYSCYVSLEYILVVE